MRLPPAARMMIAASTAASLCAVAGAAHAVVQDEIQVYDDSINKPGEVGLEIHSNTTPSGVGPNYPGEIPANHGVRITPEFSYGLSKELEAGLYLPLTQFDGQGDFHVAGVKYRMKWLPWQLGETGVGWYGGVNWELSRVGRRFSESPWMTELKPIAGYKTGDWHFTVNPNLAWNLSGPIRSAEPALAPAVKLVREVAKGISLGAEYYSELGPIGHILPWQQQDNRVYAVMDYDMKPLVFTFGVGRGITEAADKWTVKAIIEVPLQQPAAGGK